jgi:hypothetical protein
VLEDAAAGLSAEAIVGAAGKPAIESEAIGKAALGADGASDE